MRTVLTIGQNIKVHAFIVKHQEAWKERKVSVEQAAYMINKEFDFTVSEKNIKTLVSQADDITWKGVATKVSRKVAESDLRTLATDIHRIMYQLSMRPLTRTCELSDFSEEDSREDT